MTDSITSRLYNIPWPKSVTEIHAHLGGSVPLYRLWEIAIDRGIRGLGNSYEDFIDVLKIQDGKVKDLDSYLEVYDKIELIQSGPQALRESVIIAIHRAYRTGGMIHLGPAGEGGSPKPLFNIGCLELRLNPLKRTGAVFLRGTHAGLYDVDRCIKAACDAVQEVEIAFHGSIQVGLVFCFARDVTNEANRILAEKTALWASKTNTIVGVDLAGPESVNPLSSPQKLQEMKECFRMVPPHLGRTIHVGETPYVEIDTFINTIEALDPQRVAHPIVAFRAFWKNKDDRGLKLMKERGIVIEFCVKSNLLTRAVQDLAEYGKMIQTSDEFQIPYTFSTDAPSLQVTSLAEELILLLDSGAASQEQVLRALQVADDCTFVHRRFI
jgi:adenosine deaminase